MTKEFEEKIHDPALALCYNMGRDAAIHGANTTNCNFALFSSPEQTRAWENGNKAGLADRKK